MSEMRRKLSTETCQRLQQIVDGERIPPREVPALLARKLVSRNSRIWSDLATRERVREEWVELTPQGQRMAERGDGDLRWDLGELGSVLRGLEDIDLDYEWVRLQTAVDESNPTDSGRVDLGGEDEFSTPAYRAVVDAWNRLQHRSISPREKEVFALLNGLLERVSLRCPRCEDFTRRDGDHSIYCRADTW